MLLLILLILVLLFLLINILFHISIKKIFWGNPIQTSQANISVIVAAKNEAENIPLLLSSLQNLNYSEEDFEVIVVDDNSTDETFETTRSYTGQINNFSVFQNERKGKKNALTFGICKADNPFILITDVDCRPESSWLKAYSNKFRDGYDFLFGIAPFYKHTSLINHLACFENLRSSLLTLTALKLGMPYSAAARNFGFRKSSFEKIKGYSNTMETLSGDDDLLLREAIKNRMKIGVVAEKHSFVYSYTKNSLKEYLRQKSRHTKTSFYYLTSSKIFLGAWHLINIVFLFSPILLFINNVFILPFIFKMASDIILIKSHQKKFTYNFNVLQIIYLQVFYELLLIINFFNAIFRKDKWK
jgi:cellulose synthase/poly-beta-1,6-N-acetylglucosamine synthase-like glycosyltransferase